MRLRVSHFVSYGVAQIVYVLRIVYIVAVAVHHEYSSSCTGIPDTNSPAQAKKNEKKIDQ